MALYSVAYTAIPRAPSAAFPNGYTAYRPFLQAHVITPTASLACLMLADSGADQCVLPLSFAAPLGLDSLSMAMQMTGGVGSLASATYYAEVEFSLLVGRSATTLTFRTTVGFTQGLDPQGFGLLGQLGFFERFRVAFDQTNGIFTIED